ncbi:MAG: Holliday junction resolvase RuvX [Lachnospiraceae bacterium]|nr:Holliday junction resolvase RuvX [Lachnospiraceae bacterium]
MRIMGLDYGGATMGVAVSDEMLLIAQPLETIRREREKQLRTTYRRIEELIEEYDVGRIVLGLPLNMNDTVGERALIAESVAEDLRRRTGLEVIMQDERLTTVEAHRILDEAGMDWKKKAEVVDKIAASIILQSYLDSLKAEEQK